MPNWCNNRVTITAGTVEEEEQLAKIKAIFEKDNPFQVIYPMPCLLYTSPSPRD